MKQKIKYFMMVGVLAVSSIVGSLAGGVWADSGSNSMTVSPPYQKMILTPGKSYTNSLSVFNSANSTRDLKYKVEVGSFSQSKGEGKDTKDDYGSISHTNVSAYNQIMNWIELDTEGGTLAPGETVAVKYTINVPEDAPGGGQYATILVIDETTSGSLGEGNIAIDQKYQFASIIYAEVAGDTKREGEIKSNEIPSFMLNGSAFKATSMVRNNGNVHTDASYMLQVWPLFSDEEICTNEEESETSLILPETERYHAQSCELPSLGIFKAKQTVGIFGEESTVEKMIIVCPLWLLFMLLFILIAIVVWIVFKVKGGKKRKSTRGEE